MRLIAVLVATLALTLMLATSAFAVTTGAGGAGEEFGAHHAGHAQEMTGFTAEMNPGVEHQGFSGWAEHMEP